MKPIRIYGRDAIRLAERDSLTIHCHANPIDDGGIVSAGVARQIAKDDPSLIYVTVQPVGWWNGNQFVSEMPGYNASDYFIPVDMYLGPDTEGIEPRWSDA